MVFGSDGRGSERCSDLPQGTAERCSAARPFFVSLGFLPSASVGGLGDVLVKQRWLWLSSVASVIYS